MITLQEHFVAAERLFGEFGIELMRVESGAAIPGSYWGDSEAGLVGAQLMADAIAVSHNGRPEFFDHEIYETAPGTELPAWW